MCSGVSKFWCSRSRELSGVTVFMSLCEGRG